MSRLILNKVIVFLKISGKDSDVLRNRFGAIYDSFFFFFTEIMPKVDLYSIGGLLFPKVYAHTHQPGVPTLKIAALQRKASRAK